MRKICEKELCTGCFACVNACPVSCIKMGLDDDLCYRPIIDNSKCINCRKCESVCPNNNPLRLNDEGEVYSAHSADNGIRTTSTSGGIATALATQIIKNGGVVYGAGIGSELEVCHTRCTEIKELRALQGSKYVHSHINDSMSRAKEDLENGKSVLFIGTPCQISGLKCYLAKNYDKLYTIDLICHGTPDRVVFSQFSKAVLGNKYKDAVSFSFRDGNHYLLRYFDKDGNTIYSSRARESFYLSHFLDGFNLRACCYKCPYTQAQRVGDITLGDFIGLESRSEKGTNLLLVNSENGKRLIDCVTDKIILEKQSMSVALSGNNQLSHPEKTSDASKKFALICKQTGNSVKALRKCYTKKAILITLRKIIYKSLILQKIFRKFI